MSLESGAAATATAFKHPQCGGLIFMVEQEDRVYFQCNACSEVAEQLERLAIGKPVILRRRKRNEKNQLTAQELEV